MAFLFHQNMRTYGGAAAHRNATYLQAFTDINTNLVAPDIIGVAGFTEVVNDGSALQSLGQLVGALGLDPNSAIAISSGQTIGARKPEYVVIAHHQNFPIVEVGRVYISGKDRSGGVQLELDSCEMPVPPDWCHRLQEESSLDYRGIVFAIIDNGTDPAFAIAFVHNMYTLQDNKISTMQLLPRMLTLIKNDFPGNIYLGGDFNVLSDAPRGSERLGRYQNYSAFMTVSPHVPVPGVPAPRFTPGGTLMSGNLYDYWLTDVGFDGTFPAADIAPGTLGVGLSDHCGILLKISNNNRPPRAIYVG